MRLALLVLLGLAARADAYPHFQLTLGADRCDMCHVSPAGGGALNAYGRDEAGSTVSRGGDGRFLHGAWEPPDWLALHGDFRFATADRFVADRNHVLIFPMQSDVAATVMKGGFALSITAGIRGVAREPEPTYTERLASREHYVSYEMPELYVRAGRFFPVYGLRLVDHTAYVRRFQGMNLHEEPYGLELAHFAEKTEAHVTAFVPPPLDILGSGQRPSGVAALVERRFLDDKAIAGGQARAAVSADEARYTLGAITKWFVRDLLVLAELDLTRQSFRRIDASRVQLAGYLSVSHWVAKGFLATGALQLWDPDVMLKNSSRTAGELQLQFFPRAHFELHAIVRLAGQSELDNSGFLALLQAHYYL